MNSVTESCPFIIHLHIEVSPDSESFEEHYSEIVLQFVDAGFADL